MARARHFFRNWPLKLAALALALLLWMLTRDETARRMQARERMAPGVVAPETADRAQQPDAARAKRP